MRTFILFFVVLILAGCPSKESEWANAAQTHTCTADQMVKVEKETAFCRANTNYFSTYCYSSAIMRNCTKKVQ